MMRKIFAQWRSISVISGQCFSELWGFPLCFAPSGRRCALGGQQFSFGQCQIHQTEQAVELGGVLRQSLVAGLLVTEQILEHMKRMLHPGAHSGLGPLQRLHQGLVEANTQCVHRAAALGDLPIHVRANAAVKLRLHHLRALRRAGVTGIGKHLGFVSMQQIGRVGHIAGVGRGGVQSVHQAAIGIGADVGFHAEVPLVALLGGVHVGIARAGAVFGGTGRGNEGGIDHGAFAHEQAAFAQVGVDLGKQRWSEAVCLQQAAELEQGGGVGHDCTRQVDAHKLAQRLAVGDGVFQALIGQAVPLLQEIHPQHALHSDGRAAHAAALGIDGFDHGNQSCPRHDALHLAKKLLATRHALVHRMFGTGKTELVHGGTGAGGMTQ